MDASFTDRKGVRSNISRTRFERSRSDRFFASICRHCRRDFRPSARVVLETKQQSTRGGLPTVEPGPKLLYKVMVTGFFCFSQKGRDFKIILIDRLEKQRTCHVNLLRKSELHGHNGKKKSRFADTTTGQFVRVAK